MNNIKFEKAKKIIDDRKFPLGDITSTTEEIFNNFITSNLISNVVGSDASNPTLVQNKINIVSGLDDSSIILNNIEEVKNLIFIYVELQNTIRLFPPVDCSFNKKQLNEFVLLEGPCFVCCKKLEDSLWNLEITK